jgi:hypothetical protein
MIKISKQKKMEAKRKITSLKMKPKLYKAVEKKRRKNKVHKSFHAQAINLLEIFSA